MIDEVLLRADEIGMRYRRASSTAWIARRVDVLSGISFTLARRKTVLVIGQSGAGKTTLARCLTLFESPTEGSLEILGVNPAALSAAELARLRRRIQLVPQDAAGFLNPGMTVRELLDEPLRFEPRTSREDRKEKSAAVMEQCAIAKLWLGRRPAELSGGQRQRVTIARALLTAPDVLVLDEALAGLDLPAQARLLNLLAEAQQSRGLGYVFLTHDLAVARHLGGEVIVLHQGQIVERGDSSQVLVHPGAKETMELIEAMPRIPDLKERR